MVVNSGQVHDQDPKSNAIPDRQTLNSALKAVVSEQLGEPKFALWFGDGVHRRLSGEGDALEVLVPNAFFREWIKGHFAGNLVEAAQAVTGRRVWLSFAIRDEVDPPLTDVVEPEDERSRQRSSTTASVCWRSTTCSWEHGPTTRPAIASVTRVERRSSRRAA